MLTKIFYLLVAVSALMFSGCASKPDGYHDEREYSDMPWNTPQRWEGSRQIPGMSPGY
jgi:PBP1b-binding outer membrane lipoprotein LpoB